MTTTDDAVVPALTSAAPNLETRINARRVEIIATLVKLRADTGVDAVQLRDKLKAKLSALGHIINDGVVDEWASLDDAVKLDLDQWLTT